MKAAVKLQQAREYSRQNGVYLTVLHLVSFPGRRFRNQMLAAKLGVRRISIGSDSFIRGLSAMRVGEGFRAESGFWLEAVLRFNHQVLKPLIVIGNEVTVSRWSHITATNYVEIGDGALIGSKVLITDHNHGIYHGHGTSPDTPPTLRPLENDRRTIVGKNVWIGDGVVVTAGSVIGEGAVIGANSVVSGEIPPFTIAVGSPAKAVKKYDFGTSQWIRIR